MFSLLPDDLYALIIKLLPLHTQVVLICTTTHLRRTVLRLKKPTNRNSQIIISALKHNDTHVYQWLITYMRFQKCDHVELAIQFNVDAPLLEIVVGADYLRVRRLYLKRAIKNNNLGVVQLFFKWNPHWAPNHGSYSWEKSALSVTTYAITNGVTHNREMQNAQKGSAVCQLLEELGYRPKSVSSLSLGGIHLPIASGTLALT
jgi:hypothetical protein